MCSSQIEEWAKYENSWQKTERGCEGGDRMTGVTGITLVKKKLVKEKKFHQSRTDRRTTRGTPMDAGRL